MAYLLSFKLLIQILREWVQYGIVKPNVSLNFVLSSTEYAGRTTFDGNSQEWHGRMTQLLFPAISAMAIVKSYHEHTPSFEKW